MKVWRIEHPVDGRGPYRSTAGGLRGGFTISSPRKKQPCPKYDGITGFREGWFCGFTSLPDLLQWFDHIFTGLELAGFTIQLYILPDKYVERGEYQCVFDPLTVIAKQRSGFSFRDLLAKKNRIKI